MTFPYKVRVTGKDNDMNITVNPQPIATKPEYINLVGGTVSKLLTSDWIRNTMMGRARVKQELTDILKDYHKQGIIKPKEKDEGTP